MKSDETPFIVPVEMQCTELWKQNLRVLSQESTRHYMTGCLCDNLSLPDVHRTRFLMKTRGSGTMQVAS